MSKFKTILIDPPWMYDDKLDDTRKKPYPTLDIDDLAQLPLDKISDDNCHLYLWVAHNFLEEGLYLIKKWGFCYKIPIVWLKRTKHGKIWFGMGHYFRSSLEICLFAIKGKEKLKTRNTRNIIDAKKPEKHHASKPIEIYDLIESNSHAPYVEIFATRKRENWTCFGNEINQKDIRDELKEQVFRHNKVGLQNDYVDGDFK